MSSPTYRLETLGTVVLKGSDLAIRAADQRQQRRRLALLSALAATGDRGMSRDQLLLLFWPDSTQKKARHSLDQLLYAIRTSLGESVFLGTNPIRLNPDFITADVSEFTRHIAEGNLEAAVSRYTGAFLDGFYLSETREFEEWVESERRRLAQSYETALEELARLAEQAGDAAQVVHWRRKLAESDPLSTRHALALITALANAGDVSAAIAFGERYQRDASEVIGEKATATVRELVSQLNDLPANLILPTLAIPSGESYSETIPSRRSKRSVYLAVGLVAAVTIGATIFAANRAGSSDVRDPDRGTSNLAAYDHYVRARETAAARDDSAARVSLDHFRQAVALDSGFAAAHAGLARAYTRLAMTNAPDLPRSQLQARALASARKALSLNDSLAEAHTAIGLINSYWVIDFDSARYHLERAVKLNPAEPQSREFLALVYMFEGRHADALSQMREAVARNPLSPTTRATLAATQYVVGRCDLAMPALDSLGQMKPPLLRLVVIRALCHASNEDWAATASTVRASADSGVLRAMGLLGFALAKDGSRDEATALRTRLRSMTASNPAVWFEAAIISYGLDDMDTAFAELARSVDAGFLPWEVMGPPFAGLRADSRFARIAASRGIKP